MKSIGSIFVAALALTFAPAVCASPISYIETASVTGTIDGNAFSNAFATLTATADTLTVSDCGVGCFQNFAITTNINITGFGTATFTDPVFVFSDQAGGGAAGITGTISGSAFFNDILDTFSPTFASYALDQAIGPLSGPANFFGLSSMFSTSNGVLVLSSALNNETTFEASLAATPLPAALPMFMGGIGLIGLLVGRRKQKRAT